MVITIRYRCLCATTLHFLLPMRCLVSVALELQLRNLVRKPRSSPPRHIALPVLFFALLDHERENHCVLPSPLRLAHSKLHIPGVDPHLQRDANLLESFQRRYTKQLWGLNERSHEKRLIALSTTSLEYSRDTAHLIVTYKVIHRLVDLSIGEASISLQKGVTRGLELRITVLQACTESIKSHFRFRIAALWNELPY